MPAPRKAGKARDAKPCAVRLWKVFPHLFLSLSLVGYAALGAVIFKNIEGQKKSASTEDYHKFLGQLVATVQNLTNHNQTQKGLVLNLEDQFKTDFKSIWLQRPDRWDFFGSMFFCCTVFTTVGYGEIYPVTLLGKVTCVLYAMVGIPLMLLVISDVGDVLAVMLSSAYRRIHKLGKALCYRSWSPSKAREKAGGESHRTLEDGTFVFSRDVVARQPMDICQVLQSQADVKQKLKQLSSNKEIFEKILARENFLPQGPLLRSLSCPELDRMPPPPKGYAIWDFSGIGANMDSLDVPFVLILLVVVAYILLGGLILPLWETDFRGFDPYYFCFITLTTIGFGDIVPQHPKFFMITSLFIITGMAIMSMAFKLGQTRIVCFYRHCIRSMSRGHVVTMRDQEMLHQSEGYL
ncbi:Potassium channel subfamily K member 18 [Merluccius polli]|uniref:Potassium channel subfamily K member 18 n=1 Tax=Merluccius polli TaxID=89951 RepID=A0AA47P3E8_MERPO|nr:Potassium channel subfamily K member 18 [Merluccius polli]